MYTKTQGFILIKIVLAITLLALVLSVSLQMIGASATAIRGNRQLTAATFLAQQCMEWTRNLRDTAWRQQVPWDCAFRDSAAFIDETRSLELSNDINTSCGGSAKLGYKTLPTTDPQPVAPDSIYRRLLDVSMNTATQELTVACTIEWDTAGGDTKSTSMTQILTDWQKR